MLSLRAMGVLSGLRLPSDVRRSPCYLGAAWLTGRWASASACLRDQCCGYGDNMELNRGGQHEYIADFTQARYGTD